MKTLLITPILLLSACATCPPSPPDSYTQEFIDARQDNCEAAQARIDNPTLWLKNGFFSASSLLHIILLLR